MGIHAFSSNRKREIVEGEFGAAIIDPTTNTQVAIIFDHHMIHAGCSFHSDTTDLTMGLNETLILAFKTPPSRKVHINLGFVTTGDAHLDIIEAPTWTNQTGTLIPIYNRNRNSAAVSNILEDQGQASFVASENLNLNPTGLTGGTILNQFYTFGEVQKVLAGGEENQVWVLDQDTQYAIRLVSDVGSNKGQIILNWYEFVDVN